MKNFKKHTFILIFVAILVSGLVQANKSKENDALSVNSAKVTLTQAVNTALANVAGKAVNVEFSNDDGVAVWEIEVITTANKVYDVEVNAETGIFIKKELDTDDDENEDDEDDDEEDDDK
jgi:hypothetical protein